MGNRDDPDDFGVILRDEEGLEHDDRRIVTRCSARMPRPAPTSTSACSRDSRRRAP